MKRIEQNNRGRKKKRRGGAIFGDEPRWIFWGEASLFELPLLQNTQKRDKTNQGKMINIFLGLRHMYITFVN
jgi:hypothetical protein